MKIDDGLKRILVLKVIEKAPSAMANATAPPDEKSDAVKCIMAVEKAKQFIKAALAHDHQVLSDAVYQIQPPRGRLDCSERGTSTCGSPLGGRRMQIQPAGSHLPGLRA